jgi:NitT/TauT family transport system ATP-binding protein
MRGIDAAQAGADGDVSSWRPEKSSGFASADRGNKNYLALSRSTALPGKDATAHPSAAQGRISSNAPDLVVAENVSKAFKTKQKETLALQGVSLTLRRGEFLSLLGPSGCGKSTMLRLIAGLEPVTSGSIWVEHKPVTKPITNLGIVFQDPVLLDWRSVLGNVMIQVDIRRLPRQEYEAYAHELLTRVGLAEFKQIHPAELSGGMRQRVSIVRSLIHRPALLLMDEPFSALDALTRDSMNLLLHDLWRSLEKSVFFITHSLSDAVLLSERVLVMSPRPGRIIEEVNIDLPPDRTLALRETAAFARHTQRLREIFERMGVL